MKKKLVPKSLFMLAVLTASLLSFTALVPAADGVIEMGKKCKDCHAEKVTAFRTNVHTRIGSYGYKDSDCDACHGATDAHVGSGDPKAVTNPAKVDIEAASAICLNCHSKGKGQMFWHGSIHETQKLACLACHKIHGSNDKLLAKASETDVCLTCHPNVRADLFKRSKHPMRDSTSPSMEGKMTCSSCHNAHGARSEKLVDAKSFNDKCYECHAEKKAPVLWEHSPVKEDCLTCHSAHGSSNDKMLVTMVPRLCQQCHMQGRHQTGTLAPNSAFAFNRSCLNCHPMVHGSNHPSGPVLQR